MRVSLVSWIPALFLAGCATGPSRSLPPLTVVSHVDLQRFMGDWYVIANIPTFLEKGAFSPMDHYRLDPDGSIATTFTFNSKSIDGPGKSYHSRGFVLDAESNAVWGQQYVWPFKADYRISYLSEDYSRVVVARQKRDYVWIMARTPTIPEADFAALTERVRALGYDTSKLQRVPQREAK